MCPTEAPFGHLRVFWAEAQRHHPWQQMTQRLDHIVALGEDLGVAS